MALTRRDYTSDGIRTVYPVDFNLGYLRTKFVYVYLEDTPYTEQLEYIWVSRTEIELANPVPSGQVFHIRRVVDRDELINDYTNGALLSSKNLDTSFSQALMIEEELQDGYFVPEGVATFANEIIFANSIHVQEPTEDDNPATKGYVDDASEELQQNIDNLESYVDKQDAEVLAASKAYTDQAAFDTHINDDPVNVMYGAVQIADGVTKTFNSPSNKLDRTSNFLVNIDGVTQVPIDDFTISSTGQVVLNEPPPMNSEVSVAYFNANILKLEGTDGIIPQEVPRQLGDGTTAAFPTGTGVYIPEILMMITLDGVVQRAINDFTCDNVGNVVFVEAPDLNTVIDIKWYQPALVDKVKTAGAVMLMEQYITDDLIVAPPYNGVSVSPTVSDGVTVTVADGSKYVVL